MIAFVLCFYYLFDLHLNSFSLLIILLLPIFHLFIQVVREAKSEFARGGRGGGRGYGRGRGGPFRDSTNNENSYGNREIHAGQGAPDEADAGKPFERRGGYGGPRGDFRGGRRGGFSNGEVGEGERDRPRRPFDRRSGTGRGYVFDMLSAPLVSIALFLYGLWMFPYINSLYTQK